MSTYYLNNIKALKIGNSEKVVVVYQNGFLNETGEANYTLLKNHETGQVAFTRQEAMDLAVKKFGGNQEVLKRKSRNSEFYKDDELLAAFQKALMKKDKFNVVAELSDEKLLNKKTIISEAKFVSFSECGNYANYSYQKITVENVDEIIKKIENGECYYYLNFIKKFN